MQRAREEKKRLEELIDNSDATELAKRESEAAQQAEEEAKVALELIQEEEEKLEETIDVQDEATTAMI